MTAPNSPLLLFSGPQDVPVFRPAEAAVIERQPLLRPYRRLSTAQAAGLLGAIGEYSVRASAPLHRLFTGEVPTAQVLARHEELFAFSEARRFRFTAPAPARHHTLADAGLGDRPVFDSAGQHELALFKYTRGHERMTLAELCLLLERLELYAAAAVPVVATSPCRIEGLARAIHAHNRLLRFRDTPFTLDEFARSVRDVLKQVRRIEQAYRTNVANPACVPAPDASSRGDQVPDYLEPLLGWRFWRVLASQAVAGQPSGPRLASMFSMTLWTPYSAIVAQHTFGGRCLPGVPCRCGIYAFKDPERARLEMRLIATSGGLTSTPWVAGQVWLWGHYAEHQQGWRAQYAYPARLVCSRGCDAATLATLYGIPYEEDTAWTSALKSNEGLRNRFEFLYPNRLASPFTAPTSPARHRSQPSRSPRRPSVFVATRPVTLTFQSCYRIYRPVPRVCDAVCDIWTSARQTGLRVARGMLVRADQVARRYLASAKQKQP